MASQKDIKKRIVSVKNTQKITKAMKMVAAAKLRRAQQRAQNARHYTDAVWGLANRLALASVDRLNPLTIARETVRSREYLVFTSDRGLCGGFNSNLLRRFGDELEKCREKNIKMECRTIGKKGRDYFKAKNWDLKESIIELYDRLGREVAEELVRVAVQHFTSGRTDEVWLVFNYFKSAMVQEVTFQKILPLTPEKRDPSRLDYIYEPTQEKVLDALLHESLVAKVYSAFLESMASELAARMAAMENATNNASDMIDYLTLQYNRARQASITKELMEIVSGAEALR